MIEPTIGTSLSVRDDTVVLLLGKKNSYSEVTDALDVKDGSNKLLFNVKIT